MDDREPSALQELDEPTVGVLKADDEAWREVVGDDRRLAVDHQGEVSKHPARIPSAADDQGDTYGEDGPDHPLRVPWAAMDRRLAVAATLLAFLGDSSAASAQN